MKGKLKKEIKEIFEQQNITLIPNLVAYNIMKIINKARKEFPKPPYNTIPDPEKWNKWIEEVLVWREDWL